MNNPKKLGILVFVVGAFVVGLAKPFAGLAPQGHYIIAVTLVSLALWIFKTDSIPYIAGGVLFLAGCLIFKLPLAAITIGYTSSAIWVLIPALFFGFALLKSGLGKRIAYFVLKSFEPNYRNYLHKLADYRADTVSPHPFHYSAAIYCHAHCLELYRGLQNS